MSIHFSLLIAFLSINLSFFACGKDNTTLPSNFATAPASPNLITIIDLVNDMRSKGFNCNGTSVGAAGNLTANATLNEVAQKHADYLNSINQLTHTGENGSSLAERLSNEGYDFMTAAENLAQGYSDEQSVVTAWQESGGHCLNLMEANVNEIGVATSGSIWVMVLARR